MTARVGVVVRTKDRPWFLTRTLRDIRAQTLDAVRVHIVNDGGDAAAVDEVVARLEFASLDVIVTHHAASHGRSAAANAGLRGLDTEFVVVHDDDDLWDPRFLATTVRWLDDHTGDGGVMVRTEIVYEAQRGEEFVETGRELFWPDLHDITYSDLLQVNRAVPISFLYRRALHDDLGFYREDLHAVEDWEFYLRVLLRYSIGFIDGAPLAFWMQRVGVEGPLGNSMFALAAEHERFDRAVRDEALRAWVAANGPGLPLYLARFVQDEVARQLDARIPLLQRVVDKVQRWRGERRLR